MPTENLVGPLKHFLMVDGQQVELNEITELSSESISDCDQYLSSANFNESFECTCKFGFGKGKATKKRIRFYRECLGIDILEWKFPRKKKRRTARLKRRFR